MRLHAVAVLVLIAAVELAGTVAEALVLVVVAEQAWTEVGELAGTPVEALVLAAAAERVEILAAALAEAVALVGDGVRVELGEPAVAVWARGVAAGWAGSRVELGEPEAGLACSQAARVLFAAVRVLLEAGWDVLAGSAGGCLAGWDVLAESAGGCLARRVWWLAGQDELRVGPDG